MTNENYTEISQMAYDKAMAEEIKAEDVLAILQQEIPLRTFSDVIGRYVPPAQAQQLMFQGLRENDASRKPATITRNVHDWMQGTRAIKNRDMQWELCFVLGLDVEQADEFLAFIGESGIHWRDPREMVYAYGLKNGKTYPETVELLQRVLPKEATAQRGDTPLFTRLAHEHFEELSGDEDALRTYLEEQARQLGAFHSTGLDYFRKYLDELKRPDSMCQDKKEHHITTREILETHFGEQFVAGKKRKQLSQVQQAMLKDWPNEFDLSRIINGTMDVPRKALMLLFLATDGMVSGEEADDDLMYEDENGELQFYSSYERMNTMLADSGFRKLDPRNPFDWVMIYCLRELTTEEPLVMVADSFDKVAQLEKEGKLAVAESFVNQVLAAMFPEEAAGN